MENLLELMRRLRDPDTGCPWDRAQTFETISPYTIEEAYEVADAIARGDLGALKDELGDLLFQVVFHARMAEEAGAFDFQQVVGAVVDKMVRRHPHVFAGESTGGGPRSWEAIKAEERRERSGAMSGVLDGIPVAFPALMRAWKLQRRAASVGFDWEGSGPVLEKLREEVDELEQEMDGRPEPRVAEELGDVLFTCVNLARHEGVDPESALRAANERFEGRFRTMEALARDRGQRLETENAAGLDALWREAKRGAGAPGTGGVPPGPGAGDGKSSS